VAASDGFETAIIDHEAIPALVYPTDLSWAMAVPLSELPGAENLVPSTSYYYWRVRARDLRGLYSDWSESPRTFLFGPAPQPARITGLRPGENGTLVIEWEGSNYPVYVEYTPTLNPPDWQVLAGPFSGATAVISPDPAVPSGFYRMRNQ